MDVLVIIENPRAWKLNTPGATVIAAREYLTLPKLNELKRARVYNLCRTYSPQTLGYYVSLLAEARGHRPLPSVATLQDLRTASHVRFVGDEIDALAQRALGPASSAPRKVRVYFGATSTSGLDRLARALFNHLPAPLLEAEFRHAGTWRLESVRAIATSEIADDERAFVTERAERHFGRRAVGVAARTTARWDLAILHNPRVIDSPSDARTVQRFVKAAQTLGMEATVIGKEDFADLAAYDALFIRETTEVNHYTYRFSRRAEAEGLVVMDAPEAILRCTNKVYLAEIFARHGIPAPKTRIVHKDDNANLGRELGFPIVLKRPDSSFSQGVVKARDDAELKTRLGELLQRSELVVAQEFTPSEFDWRVGVLDRKPLFAARYHMAPGHWQIQRTGQGGYRRYGRVDAVALSEVPSAVIDAGVRSASLIGDGLFGVDVKEVNGRALVMEVNDNPNIEIGYEDVILKDELYLTILRSFLTRLETRGRKEKS